jgi:hypothetical protein
VRDAGEVLDAVEGVVDLLCGIAGLPPDVRAVPVTFRSLTQAAAWVEGARRGVVRDVARVLELALEDTSYTDLSGDDRTLVQGMLAQASETLRRWDISVDDAMRWDPVVLSRELFHESSLIEERPAHIHRTVRTMIEGLCALIVMWLDRPRRPAPPGKGSAEFDEARHLAYVRETVALARKAGRAAPYTADRTGRPSLPHLWGMGSAASVASGISPRCVVYGGAGVGKTTLVGALADAMVAGRPAKYAYFVPFLVHARDWEASTWTRDLAVMLATSPRVDARPAGDSWVDSVFRSGRAYLIVDGLDELSPSACSLFWDWLADVVDAFPDNRYLVTTRPLASAEGPAPHLAFEEIHVGAMAPAERNQFVAHWHRQRRYPEQVPSAVIAYLDAHADVAELAAHPFACAALCEIHGASRREWPLRRHQLYNALIDRCLVDADIPGLPSTGRIKPAALRSLLEELAWEWLHSGVSVARGDLGIRLGPFGRDVEPGWPRTGLLHVERHGWVTFFHPGIREALAAGRLLCHLPQGPVDGWGFAGKAPGVLRFAAGRANPEQLASLLQGLVAEGDARRSPVERALLYATAAGAVSEAADVPSGLVAEVVTRLRAVVPAATEEIADALRIGGQGAVEELLANARAGEAPRIHISPALIVVEADERRFPAQPPDIPAGPAADPLEGLLPLPELLVGARELAVALSTAVRIEPELIRAVRLAVCPHLDAGAEADLWFSPWVAARTDEALTLRVQILPELRAELRAMLAASEPDAPVRSIGDLVARLHENTSPALALEERLCWADVIADVVEADDADALLQPALRALIEDGRTGIADWLAGAWSRLPASARETVTAWQLHTAAAHRQPDLELRPVAAPDTVSTADVAVIAAALPDVELPVELTSGTLVFGGSAEGAIRVPDTHPRVVDVLDGARVRTVLVPQGEPAVVTVGPGPVFVRTPTGDVYDADDFGGAARGARVLRNRGPRVWPGADFRGSAADVVDAFPAGDMDVVHLARELIAVGAGEAEIVVRPQLPGTSYRAGVLVAGTSPSHGGAAYWIRDIPATGGDAKNACRYLEETNSVFRGNRRYVGGPIDRAWLSRVFGSAPGSAAADELLDGGGMPERRLRERIGDILDGQWTVPLLGGQAYAANEILSVASYEHRPRFRLFGPPGSGKTTVGLHILRMLWERRVTAYFVTRHMRGLRATAPPFRRGDPLIDYRDLERGLPVDPQVLIFDDVPFGFDPPRDVPMVVSLTPTIDLKRRNDDDHTLLSLPDVFRFGGVAAFPGWLARLLDHTEKAEVWRPDPRFQVFVAGSRADARVFLNRMQAEGRTVLRELGDALLPATYAEFECDWVAAELTPDPLVPAGGPRGPVPPGPLNRYWGLTRATRGVVLYSTDPATRAYLQRHVPDRVGANGLPIRTGRTR